MKSRWDDILDWMKKNYRYLLIGLLFLVLVIVLLVVTLKKGKKEVEVPSGDATVSDSAVTVPEADFEVDAHTDVNELITTYFTAMESGDVATLRQLCQGMDEKEEIRIEEKATYIESFNNFTCYTKPGPEENSYIVFAYYDVKFKNIDTMAPSLTSLYVCTAEDGTLYVNNNEMTQDVIDYIEAISEQNDVIELLTKVDTTYKEAVDMDANLDAFMTALPSTLDAAVKAVMDERQVAADQEAANAAASEVSGNEATTDIVRAKEKVNVRKSASETADKLGQVEADATFTRLEQLENGWSKIEFQGNEAYIKTEFLEPVGGSVDSGTQETGGAEGEPDTTAPASSGATSAKTAKSNINVRASASETAEKIGTVPGGNSVKVVEDRNDGWSKIDYNGKTGYVKTEFLQ